MKLRNLLARMRARSGGCAVCDGDGTVMATWAYKRRVRACTCGAGDGQLVMHDYRCDTVPCPFCQLVSA